MTHDEMIAVIQAHKDGKVIEAKYKGRGGSWGSCREPGWNFNEYDFRVKPEPREVWINQYPCNVIGEFVYCTYEDAKRNSPTGLEPLRFREVLD